MDSMNKDLQESLHSTPQNKFSRSRRLGGLLTFTMVIDNTINLSEVIIEGMVGHFKGYKINQVLGKDIKRVYQRILFASKQLENNGSLTKDIMSSLFKVFQVTSVKELNAIFALM